MQTDLIVISEYCQNCHVDPSFIKMLRVPQEFEKIYYNPRL